MPDADVKVCDLKTLLSASVSARFKFAATFTEGGWIHRDTTIIDAFFTLFPMYSVFNS